MRIHFGNREHFQKRRGEHERKKSEFCGMAVPQAGRGATLSKRPSISVATGSERSKPKRGMQSEWNARAGETRAVER